MAILEMAVLDMKGDTRHTWDSNNPVEVEHAHRVYDEMKQRGFTAHVTSGSGKGGTMGEFDPNAEGLVMVPPMAAG